MIGVPAIIFVCGLIAGSILFVVGYWLIDEYGRKQAFRRYRQDVPPFGWSVHAIKNYTDQPLPPFFPYRETKDGSLVAQMCTLPGRCIVDHQPCNGFPRLDELA